MDAVCAGHVCLDMTPRFSEKTVAFREVFAEGMLTEVGDMELTPGGSVTNTGIALTRLGFPTALMGKVGADDIGTLTAETIREFGGDPDCLSVREGDTSSYSVVLAVPGHDRIFLHHPGANHTFTHEDIDWDVVGTARLFHFGYAPLMRRVYENDGEEQQKIMQLAKDRGACTSLDLAMPDMRGPAGTVNWKKVLARTLPYTDIFAPSVEELLLMLAPEEHTRIRETYDDVLEGLDLEFVRGLGAALVEMGAAVVVIKCGVRGFYLRTAGPSRLAETGRVRLDPDKWADREMFSGIFRADRVVSATGAGDTSIAGFLAAVLQGLGPADAVETACGCGAFCVTETAGAAGIPSFRVVRERIDSGWEKLPVEGADVFDYAEDLRMYVPAEETETPW